MSTNEQLTVGSRIELQGIVYVVEQIKTPADHDADGHHNVAKLMRDNGKVADVVVRRPRGKALHYAVLGARGTFSNLTRI